MAYFPVVGATLGTLIGLSWGAARRRLPPLPAAALVVAMDALMTGALHLDGLADTADGLCAHVPAKTRLEIMAEPQVGTFAVVALGIVLSSRTATLRGPRAVTRSAGCPLLLFAIGHGHRQPGLAIRSPRGAGNGLLARSRQPRQRPCCGSRRGGCGLVARGARCWAARRKSRRERLVFRGARPGPRAASLRRVHRRRPRRCRSRLRDGRPSRGLGEMTSWARPVPLVGDKTSVAQRAGDPRWVALRRGTPACGL